MGQSVTIAYADPPYLGQAKKHYDDSTYDNLAAHEELIGRLVEYDGWAYSLTSTTLRDLLPLFPAEARVGAWVKPFAVFKPGVNPAYAWEPVIFKPSRKRGRDVPTVRDWCSVNITLKRGLVGAKPEAFCHWLFEVLGAEPTDEFIDIFPGSGAVADAWRTWS